jgi:hypothetical protein
MRSPITIVRNFAGSGPGELLVTIWVIVFVTSGLIIGATAAVWQLDVSDSTMRHLESLAVVIPLGGMLLFWLRVLRAI